MNIITNSTLQSQSDEQLKIPPREATSRGGKFTTDGYALVRSDELTDAWLEWIDHQRDWKTFITFTNKSVDLRQETLVNSWLRLVRYINKEVFGNNYTRIVHHSYFSYVLGIEKQKRGALHIHALVDRPVPFAYLRRMWEIAFDMGWVGIDKVDDKRGAVSYMVKYVMKGGDVIPFIASQSIMRLKPVTPFEWWIE